jgi:hypothetical protein
MLNVDDLWPDPDRRGNALTRLALLGGAVAGSKIPKQP